VNKELEKVVRETEINFMGTYLSFADKALELNCLDEAGGFLAHYQSMCFESNYKGKEIDNLNKRYTEIFEKYKTIKYEEK